MRLLVIIGLVALAAAYPSFMDKIPNGAKVVNPCDNTGWVGVGHRNQKGSGKLNPFGETFESAHEEWTSAVCRADSDGDGRSNGEELGDPDCRWRPGQTPSRTSGITHPGVCESVTSVTCKSRNSWLNCKVGGSGATEEFCPLLKTAGARTIDFRMNDRAPTVEVPTEETNYYCQRWKLPDDEEYQFIAFEPLIDNQDLFHHALLYACDPKETEKLKDSKYNSPVKCGMGVRSPDCRVMVATWGSGGGGWCLDEKAGSPFGRNFYGNIWMEAHWNNPKGKSGITDRSGLRAHYIRKSRPFNMALLTLDQRHLMIPPGAKETVVTAKLEAECTEALFEEGVVYTVDTAFPHMHLLGSGSSLTLTKKNGVKEVLFGGDYDYTTPERQTFKNGIKLEAGDALEFVCKFDSQKEKDYTFWGFGTQGSEMCMAFLTYFPPAKDYSKKEQLSTWIVSTDDFHDCRAHTWEAAPRGCGLEYFNEKNVTQKKLVEACMPADKRTLEPRTCNPKCMEILAINDMLAHPCLRGPMLHKTITYNWKVVEDKMYQHEIFTVAPMIELCMETAKAKVLEIALNNGKTIAASDCAAARVARDSSVAAVLMATPLLALTHILV